MPTGRTPLDVDWGQIDLTLDARGGGLTRSTELESRRTAGPPLASLGLRPPHPVSCGGWGKCLPDGADLPTICQKLTGDDPAGLYSRLSDVAHSIGFAVENAELPGTVNGDCTHTLHRIRVEITNSPAQRVKTLAHEIGHALLH